MSSNDSKPEPKRKTYPREGTFFGCLVEYTKDHHGARVTLPDGTEHEFMTGPHDEVRAFALARDKGKASQADGRST